jgi:NAD-dependent dihydropyrimidine dehydrogenase PreA subunit
MAKNWYPLIEEELCQQCGACVEKCRQGVFDKDRAPVPVVVGPERCVDHCHGCGNLCPSGALTYMGEDTGWIPPAFRKGAEPEPCCGCGCSDQTAAGVGKPLKIEYLYLDLETCDRCLGTDALLEEVVAVLRPALELAGYRVTYEKHEIKDARMAEGFRFLSSPTIRVNGRDIFGEVQESNCTCCGEIAGTAVDCRVFAHEGQIYEVPTRQMLTDGILKSLAGQGSCTCEPYVLPENLKRFFRGKENKAVN